MEYVRGLLSKAQLDAAQDPSVKTLNLSTSGMILTLIVNVVIFTLLLGVFEVYRFYKQIFLKRYQNRYVSTMRVPDKPPDHLFGWLIALWNVSEFPDFLNMVGLDGYMLLRYHTLCMKLCLFLTFWGLLVLLPIYSTVPSELSGWDRYTILNVIAGPLIYQRRLWVTTATFYLFAAYFCQLLFAEYHNFSNLRLQFLSKDDPKDDPDTHPQTYYTIMLEKIPPELRSAEKLYEYFEEIFPSEVFTVELALDLRDLNALCAKRKSFRDKLEKSIAIYNVTAPKRPTIHVKTGDINIDLFDPTGEDRSFDAFWEQFVTPERWGYEKLDCINYYTAQLRMLNEETLDLQSHCFEKSRSMDKAIQRRLKNKFDSRAAEAVEKIGQSATNYIKKIGGIENILFGPSVQVEDSVAPSVALNDNKKRIVTKNTKAPAGGKRRSRVTKIIEESPVLEVKIGSDVAYTNVVNPMHDEELSVSTIPTTNIETGGTNDAKTDGRVVNIQEVIGNSRKESLSLLEKYNKLIQENDEDEMSKQLTVDTTIGPRSSFTVNDGTILQTISPFTSMSIEDNEAPEASHENKRQSIDSQYDGYTIQDSSSDVNPSIAEIDAAFGRTISHPVMIPANNATTSTDSINGASEQRRGSVTEMVSQLETATVDRGKQTLQQGWAQTKIAGMGFALGVLEAERAIEMVVVGSQYNYSSTAFVTFKTRMAETIAYQMNLSDEASMEILHAPNPNDIIWDNISIPKSQIAMRNTITNIGLAIGAFFWSSLVNSVNHFAKNSSLPENQQNFLSVIILLVFLLILPFGFDFLARYYECMKLESEVQNSIMTRYFYYQLVNIYVIVGLGGINIGAQMLLILRNPQTLVRLLGGTIPAVSLYFCNLVIVKIFTAVPIEMLRPWQLSTILAIGTFMDRRQTTRRELRTGAFYAWPMLYGWVYPQLMMVQMIIITYSSICPLLMPLGVLFFIFAYIMYKYQLLYVYVNDYQSHGFMWYQVFNFSIIGLLFATCTLLGYLGLHLSEGIAAGPFFLLLPLPVCIVYFWNYSEHKFKNKMDLSFQRAKYIDNINESKRRGGHFVPQDSFKKHLFRQPTLTEKPQYPEPYRKVHNDSFLEQTRKRSLNPLAMGRNRASSINVHTLIDDDDETEEVLQSYFHETVLGTLVKLGNHPLEQYTPFVPKPRHASPVNSPGRIGNRRKSRSNPENYSHV